MGKVWRYQRGNKNPYIEEEQTTQWSKEKVEKDKEVRPVLFLLYSFATSNRHGNVWNQFISIHIRFS
jgi:hypothetical protein